MFDIKRLTKSPKNFHESIRYLIKKEQELLTALHIMQSIIDNPDDKFKELHSERINKFLAKYRTI